MDLAIQRGDVVICVLSGDYGKPRPALVVQSDLFNPTHTSFTICPITTHLVEAPLFRLSITPTQENGLKQPSQIMIDKIMSLRKEKLSQKIGNITTEQLNTVNHALKIWLNLDEI